MLVSVDGSSFVVDYKFGFDFCRAIEKCSPKNDYVYISYDGTNFYLFSQDSEAVVFASHPVEGGKTFNMGVESPKFVALFKRLYEGSKIKFTPRKNFLLVVEDNISVKFPAASYVKQPALPELSCLRQEDTESILWLAQSIVTCGGSIGETPRFSGILIDNTVEGLCRVVKFSETAVRLCAHPTLSLWDDAPWSGARHVLPFSQSKALQVFKDEVQNFFFSSNMFGYQLRSSVIVLTPKLYDDLPICYADALGLQSGVMQIDPAGRKYVFNKKRFLEVLDLVSTVVGTEESLVVFSVSGIGSSGNPVWSVSAKTHNGCEVQELVECLVGGATDMIPFRVHKNRAINSMKLHQEHLVFYDKDETSLVITDETGADVTLLIKAPV